MPLDRGLVKDCRTWALQLDGFYFAAISTFLQKSQNFGLPKAKLSTQLPPPEAETN